MKDNNKVRKAVTPLLMTVFFSFAVVYSSNGQEQVFGGASMDADHPISKAKESGAAVQFAENVNADAKATPLNRSINGPYQEVKPRLAPNGNRLYFSRIFHPDNTNGVNDPEDIWYAEFDRETGSWSEPLRMVSHLNNAGPNYINEKG